MNLSDPFGLCPPENRDLADCQFVQNAANWAAREGHSGLLNTIAAFDATMTGLSALFSDPSAGSPWGAAASGFASFRSFKNAAGVAGEGVQWHHIVEQAGNAGRFGAEAVHSVDNLVQVPTAVHQRIGALYSSKRAFSEGQTVRMWLRDQSFADQMKFGLDVLRNFGIIR